METIRICPNCRKPLPPDVPLGLCPECLIKSGFPTGTEPGAAGEVAGARFVPPPVAEIAQLFPQLEILRLIGKGGMGAVYKARQPALDRFVALKVLPPAVASDPGFAERFNREARALARLSHPNIVAIYDFGKAIPASSPPPTDQPDVKSAPGKMPVPLWYLLMEFVDGTNLREVERAGELTPEQALAIVPQICEALQFAHNEGIVHRDIKPENLLLDKKGRVKITDFGIAKMVTTGPAQEMLTGVKDVVGTPHYMAPEQLEKPLTVDHRADIYSLGVVFYEMLTGELPLGKFEPPSKKVHIDVRLDEVVLHALEKEPSRRYQQVSQVKTEVESITGTPAPGGVRPLASLSPAGNATSDKAILPALLLAFPFGLFGAHRFYTGKIGTAFLQLAASVGCILMINACATTGGNFQPTLGILLGFSLFGCFIWAVTDWILILCKAFTDGQGRRMTHWLHPQNGNLKTGTTPITTPPTGPPSGPPTGGTSPAAGAGSPLAPMTPKAASAVGTGIIVAPAVALIIAGLWKMLSVLLNGLFLLPGGLEWLDRIVGGRFFSGWGSMAIVSLVLFKFIPGMLILYGGYQMLQRRSYAWAVAAGIIAIVACSIVSLPIGIWALIVLAREDVKSIFTNTAHAEFSRKNPWPWVGGTVLIAATLVLVALGLNHLSSGIFTVDVSGTVTDAVTGQPIAGARVDDNRYGADPDQTPAQSWTDAGGHYELHTRYEEHTIAASAPGYQAKLSILRPKSFGPKRNVSMDFRLQPAPQTPLPAAAGTQEINGPSPKETATPVPVAPAIFATAIASNAAPWPTFQPVRIRVGSSESFVDHDGNLWSPDEGFADGQISERPGLAIVNTQDPELYRTERYGMTSFTYPVPNGKYLVKLHFAETYDAITGPNERVFTFIVEGHEVRDFDVWAEAGGAQRACVKTLEVEVTDGVLNISFVPQRQNPQINGIEILPLSPAVVAAPLPSPKTKPPPDAIFMHREKIIANLSTTDPFQQDFNQTLPLSADGRLRLDNVNGRIQIAGWDRNEVSIKALKHGKTRESVEAVKINVDASPDEISIHTQEPSGKTGYTGIWPWFGGDDNQKATVDYAIQVPRRARLANVSSVNGRVEIDGVSGDIEASTVNGAMAVHNVTGSLKLSAVNGWIDTELVSLGGNQSVSLDTVNGAIEATLPTNADAEITADTVNGGMTSGFPELVVKKEFPLSKHLKGTLGNGGASIKINTVNGGISIQQGKSATPVLSAPIPEIQKAAVAAAQAWLALIDDGRYSESWNVAEPYLQRAVTEPDWETSMNTYRKPLGNPLSRQAKSAQFMTEMPGAPDGQYVVMQFDSLFTDKKSAVETVTFKLADDGKWKASGYYIK